MMVVYDTLGMRSHLDWSVNEGQKNQAFPILNWGFLSMNNPLKQTVRGGAIIGAFAGIAIGLYFFSANSLMIAISCGLGTMIGNFVHSVMKEETRTELKEAFNNALAEIEHKQEAINLMQAMMYSHFHPSEEEYIGAENVEKWIRTRTDDEIRSWLHSEINTEHGIPPDTFEEWFEWQSNR
ncbi:MAG: hypothetical protein KJO80_16140 [Gammaproteobacteria bacterium]|nr:hypothetical protein [Gammaproteobacteria bacterium]NNK98051.1 DUF456 domain-containing protein [Xanthomonadales bacterium]